MNAISLEEISLPYKLWKRHLCVNKLNIKKCLWKKRKILKQLLVAVKGVQDRFFIATPEIESLLNS